MKKIVYLIQKWGIKFEGHSEIPLFTEVYQALKKSGVQFPDPPKSSTIAPVPDQSMMRKKPQEQSKDLSSLPRKYQKLINDMNLVKGNINLTNEIIDGMQPGEKNETLTDLVNTLTSMEPKLFTLIGQVENEEVMNTCLLVNDDLQKTFKRYHAVREGRRTEAFVPGESTKNTLLTPTHIYSKGTAPRNSTAAVSQPKPTQPVKKTDQIPDLFDFGPPKQQQQP